MTTEDRYVYDVVQVQEVPAADVYRLRLSTRAIGFRLNVELNVQMVLFGYDTPQADSRSPFERTEAESARIVAETWLNERKVKVRTHMGDDLYLGEPWDVLTGELLGEHLRTLGLAAKLPARWAGEYDIPI